MEGIGYGVPAFKYRSRPLVSFGAGKQHCSFYVQSPAVLDAHRDELAGYKDEMLKGTLPLHAGQAAARSTGHDARQGANGRDGNHRRDEELRRT